MKYQAYHYTVNVDSRGEFYIEDIRKGAIYETEHRQDFEQVSTALGFNSYYVSMNPDFPNDNVWELILKDGQPVGQIHEIYV